MNESTEGVGLDETATKQIFDNGFAGNVEEPHKKQSRWRKYWKTIAAAGFLLLAGIIFLIVAFVDLQNKQTTTRGVAFLVIGTLCALPGGYQCYLIWQAYKRRPGYSFSQVPSYDY